MKRIWRKVISFTSRPSSDGFVNNFRLECGHVVSAKASQGEPSKKACYFCESNANKLIKREE